MDLEPAPSHASLGIVAGGSFVALAIAAFASGYLLVRGSRVSAPETSGDMKAMAPVSAPPVAASATEAQN